MTKKQFIRCVAFFVVCAVMALFLCDVFEQENTQNNDQRMYSYRNLEKNSIDAFIMGTSGVDRYWIAAKAYEDYGMTVYPFSSDALPCWLYTEILDEALSYHTPELIILDIRAFVQDNNSMGTMDVRARRILDTMPIYSINRLKAAIKVMKVMQTVDENAPIIDFSYLFSFIKYHGNWSSDDFRFSNNLGEAEHEYLGFYIDEEKTIRKMSVSNVAWDPYAQFELDPLSQSELHRVIEYIKKKNLNVLFIDTPQANTLTRMGRANTIYGILESEGIPYIEFNSTDTENFMTIDLDFEKEFYDARHVNFYGAKKFTDAFAKYLDENYNFTDRRNDEKVAERWGGVYSKLCLKIQEFEQLAQQKQQEALQQAGINIITVTNNQ